MTEKAPNAVYGQGSDTSPEAHDQYKTTLRQAIETATYAPSGHNIQPWRFRLGSDSVDLFADRTRALPVLDPEGRELVIGCGAALFYLQLAVRRAGYSEKVTLLPDPGDPDWLARLQITGVRSGDSDDFRLFGAIPRRRTNRLSFYDRPLPDGYSEELASIARDEETQLTAVTPAQRGDLVRLIVQGAQELAGSDSFREELIHWTEKAAEFFDPETGVTNYPIELGRHLTYMGPFTSSHNPARYLVAQESRLAQEAPLMVVLSTTEDTPLAWLKSGQALAHLLLHAASSGVMAAFLNTPVQVKSLRPQVARLLEMDKYPQLILALGHAPFGQRTPRRSLEDILIEE